MENSRIVNIRVNFFLKYLFLCKVQIFFFYPICVFFFLCATTLSTTKYRIVSCVRFVITPSLTHVEDEENIECTYGT